MKRYSNLALYLAIYLLIFKECFYYNSKRNKYFVLIFVPVSVEGPGRRAFRMHLGCKEGYLGEWSPHERHPEDPSALSVLWVPAAWSWSSQAPILWEICFNFIVSYYFYHPAYGTTIFTSAYPSFTFAILNFSFIIVAILIIISLRHWALSVTRYTFYKSPFLTLCFLCPWYAFGDLKSYGDSVIHKHVSFKMLGLLME